MSPDPRRSPARRKEEDLTAEDAEGRGEKRRGCATECRAYKARFALLPTVDHLDDGLGPPAFKICSWRTNDAKHDLALGDFVELCEKVIRHNGGSVRD